MGQAEHFITQFAQEAARYNRYGNRNFGDRALRSRRYPVQVQG